MTVPIICNANQARSVVGTSFLQALYPSIKFKSYGVNAAPLTRIPKKTIDVLNKWHLPLMASKCINIRSDISDLRTSKIVIASDTKVAEILFSMGISREVVGIIDNLNLPRTLIPIDPVGLHLKKFEIELAKFALCASLLFARMTNYQSGIKTHLPWTQHEYEVIIDSEFSMPQTGINLIVDISDKNDYIGSLNVYQIPIVISRVKPQYFLLELRKILKTPSPVLYYIKVDIRNFHELIRLNNEILEFRKSESQKNIKMSLIIGPLFTDEGIQIMPLLSASASYGNIRISIPGKYSGLNKDTSYQGSE